MSRTSEHRASVALFGEALMDHLPTGPVPGGAPLNVARHLQALGLSPLLVTRGWPTTLSAARAERFARSICTLPGATPLG